VTNGISGITVVTNSRWYKKKKKTFV